MPLSKDARERLVVATADSIVGDEIADFVDTADQAVRDVAAVTEDLTETIEAVDAAVDAVETAVTALESRDQFSDTLTITEIRPYLAALLEFPEFSGMTGAIGVTLEDGTVLYAGSDGGTPPKSARWDPATDTWTAIEGPDYSGLNVGQMGGCRLTDGRAFLAGGWFFLSGSPFGNPTAPYLFDPATNTFTTGADMPGAGRAFPIVVPLPAGKALVFAGAGEDQTCYEYDSVADSWEAVGDTPRAPTDAPMWAKLASGKIVVAYRGEPGLDLYDPATQTWSSVAFSASSSDLGWRSGTDWVALLIGQSATGELWFAGYNTALEISLINTFTESAGWQTPTISGDVPPIPEEGDEGTFFAGRIEDGYAVVTGGSIYLYQGGEWVGLGPVNAHSPGNFTPIEFDGGLMLPSNDSDNQLVVVAEQERGPQVRLDLSERVAKLVNRNDDFLEFETDDGAVVAKVDQDGAWNGPVRAPQDYILDGNLSQGSSTCYTTLDLSDAEIILVRKAGGTPANWGHLYVDPAQTVPGESFTVMSTNEDDDGNFLWYIVRKSG